VSGLEGGQIVVGDPSDDLEAIRQLKARYFRMMDTKNWDGLADVFTEDVVIDMTGEGAGVTRSRAEYMPFIQDAVGHLITVHHGHMPEIALISSTTATGVWAMEDELWWPEGSPIAHMHAFGHYHESYEKQDGEWRIKTMTLTRLHRLVTAPDE
jgi:hypothetical protein